MKTARRAALRTEESGRFLAIAARKAGESMKTELRRHQVNLVTLGSGTILLGGWTVLKTLLYLWMGTMLDPENTLSPGMLTLVKLILSVVFSLFTLAAFGVRLYVGRAAQREGMGTPQKNTYLFLAALILLIDCVSILYSAYAFFAGNLAEQSRLDFVVSSVVDMTSVALLTDMIVTARRIRKLRAELEG